MIESISLKEHLQAEIAALKELTQADAKAMRDAVATAMAAADKATDRSDAAMKGRLDVLNEFRGAVDVLIANCPTRAEIEMRFKPLEEYKTAQTASTAGQKALLVLASAIVGLVLGIASVSALFQPDPVTVAPRAATVNINEP